MPDLLTEFASHPQGQLGTVHVTAWQVAGRVLLLGDAAHAIVPFHGQGMNAAFEDCAVLDALLERPADWPAVFAQFEQSRRPNAAAIAQMALENYTEMRDAVLDARFVRRRDLALGLERRFPDRFHSALLNVMFHPEIPYAEALRRGALQAQLLDELDRERAASRIGARGTAGPGAPAADNLSGTPPRRLVMPWRLRCVAALERHERDWIGVILIRRMHAAFDVGPLGGVETGKKVSPGTSPARG